MNAPETLVLADGHARDKPLASPLSPDFADNPYATYARWRAEGPLLWSDAFFGGAWLLTRHADVESALRDVRLSAQRTGGWVMDVAEGDRAGLTLFQRLFTRALLFLDAPEHTRLRQVLMPAFRPQRLQALQRGEMPPIATKIMMNVGTPQLAFDFAQLPNEGVGLARLEFIINNNIGVHPKAILDYPNIDNDLKKAVESVARGHASPRAFYVDKVAEGVATIAAAFWPKPVIVRLSDFKSNEYRKLIGGSRYEPEEENPMLGFRGAARYISTEFGEAFAMECEALKRVRNDMGLTNVQVMVPFVRTLGQAERVTKLLAAHGLERGKDDLKVIMMCEVPSNAILADRFLEFFDGFSIGSNDLTQLTLGLDRDSGLELLAKDFDERDPAVEALIHQAIKACLAQGKYIGICGQGPSDHPDFAQWLAKEGISSISLNPDSVIVTWQQLAR